MANASGMLISPASPTQASWMLVMPSECRCRCAASSPAVSSAWVGARNVVARPAAWRRRAALPSGFPSWSRSIRPSAGSVVSLVTSAMASAALFTQALWWSRFGRNAGRPPVTASRSAAVGRAAGEGGHRPAAAEHPGVRRQCPRSRRRPRPCTPALVLRPARLQRSDSRPPCTGWTWASPNAGMASRPRRSTTRVNGPMKSRISSSPQSASMVPPLIAAARVNPDGWAGVLILPVDEDKLRATWDCQCS